MHKLEKYFRVTPAQRGTDDDDFQMKNFSEEVLIFKKLSWPDSEPNPSRKPSQELPPLNAPGTDHHRTGSRARAAPSQAHDLHLFSCAGFNGLRKGRPRTQHSTTTSGS